MLPADASTPSCAQLEQGTVMLHKIEPRRTSSPQKKPYTAPRLTELGNIDANDGLMRVSPELQVTLLAMKEAMNRDQSGS